MKILIDTDPGQDIDDLLAIWFALRRPELEILGIATVTWPSDRRARLVKRLLRHLDRTDIPVAAGMQYPLRPLDSAERAAQHDLPRVLNHGSFAEPEDPADAPGDADAVDLIIRTIEQHPGEVMLCCLAPLTNIATALCRRPEIAGKIQSIALMGGEVNLNRREHNIAFDYTAAAVVLHSGIPIAMGTWDVTRRFVLSMGDCRHIGAHGTPLCRAMADAIQRWHPVQSWKPGPVMYDLFPLVHAFDRSYYTTQPMTIGVETASPLTRGMTVPTAAGPTIDVTTDLRAADLRELYLSTILG